MRYADEDPENFAEPSSKCSWNFPREYVRWGWLQCVEGRDKTEKEKFLFIIKLKREKKTKIHVHLYSACKYAVLV